MAKTPRPATDAGVHIGQVLLGKYRVEEILGQGGMGIVARCTHLLTDAQIAIKMLRSDVLTDEDATQRFMREAQNAVRLRSEYVAHVHDVGVLENGVPYMCMEFLDGHDLGALIEEQGHVAVPWAVELMLQAAEALAEAHSISIVHRDVKPTNLFVTWRPDGTSLIKVLDFGISKSPMGTDMQLTQTQSLLGTPAYMSPEQMRSARLVDARTDIWSLGTVMYELLEGRRPFEAESFSEMCVKVAVDPPAPMTYTPPALQQVVLRCLAKSPEQRYASMAELGRDLIPFARDPHQATMLVERMTRMLGRGQMATPIPGAVRDFKSGPVRRMQSPAWHGGSDAQAIPLADPATLKEKSAPAIAPVTTSAPRRGKAPLVIGLLTLVAAAGAIVFLTVRESDATRGETVEMEVRPSPAAAPPATSPPPEPAPAVTPPITPDAAIAVTPDAASVAPEPKPAAAKRPPKPRVSPKKNPVKPPIEKTVEKPPVKESDPQPPKRSLDDLYSKPRPDRK